MSEVVRKLASIRRIAALDPIEGADQILKATIDGWELVTAKSNGFEVGQLVVYFEVDSFLPVTEEFEWLRKSSFRRMGEREGFRIKTIKLRGQVSQGLIVPIPQDIEYAVSMGDLGEGSDLTDYYGIVKWDPPLPASMTGVARGNFPSFIPKTDQERIQNRKWILDCGEEFEQSLKLDGSSMTVYMNEGRFGVCSRNLDLEETEDSVFWRTARSCNLEEALRAHGGDLALQGEVMGPGVQGNREKLEHHQFFLFDVYDIANMRYLLPHERYAVFSYLSDWTTERFDHVPTRAVISFNGVVTLDDIKAAANDDKSINHDIAEGHVYKSMSSDKSVKCISEKFLLKEKD